MKSFFIHLKERGFFKYAAKNLLMILLIYGVLVLLIYLIGKYLVDFESLFNGLLSHMSDRFVLLLFFVSESFTGMIPVDLFVVWTQKFERPLPYLALLGILSYSGGVISYGIGKWISGRPKIKLFMPGRMAKAASISTQPPLTKLVRVGISAWLMPAIDPDHQPCTSSFSNVKT